MSAPTPYFGRAWKLKVTPQATAQSPNGTEEWTISNSSWDTEALRITFTVETVAFQSYWFADIVIYNFAPAEAHVIKQGDLVTLEAGYQSPGMGLIFSGRIFQPIWERRGETDFTLTLHCVVGLFEDQNGYVSVPFGAGATPADCVNLVASSVKPNIHIDYLDPILSRDKLPRGAAYAGYATRLFCDVARSYQLNCWYSWKGLSIRSLVASGDVPDLVYAPPYSATTKSEINPGGLTKYTLLGTPQQTQEGANFTILLDSDLQLSQLVRIDQAILNQVRLIPGQLPPRGDGLYVVAGIRHIGDSRGNEWLTEVTGVTRDYSKILAAGQAR